jgi:hypothetical protein
MRLEALDLSALTVELASTFRSLIESGGLTYTVDVQHLPEPILMDREHYEKILFNLLSNGMMRCFVLFLVCCSQWLKSVFFPSLCVDSLQIYNPRADIGVLVSS